MAEALDRKDILGSGESGTIVSQADFRHNLGFRGPNLSHCVDLICRRNWLAHRLEARNSQLIHSQLATHPPEIRLMISEQIEKIKSEYTDKYVTVRADMPELARFKNYVGQVKTVNMSGRALVQFNDFYQNTGWYDIDLDYLKVVDKPIAKEGKKLAARQAAGKPAAKKLATAAGEKKLSPLELARQQGAAKSSATTADKAPAGKKSVGKPSTADILAAARGGSAKSPAQAAGQAPKAKGASQPAPPAGSSPPQGGKLSTADILAAARSGSAKSPAAEAQGPSEPAAADSRTAAQVSEDANAPESAQPALSSGSAASSGSKGKSGMSPEDICAWCREHDA